MTIEEKLEKLGYKREYTFEKTEMGFIKEIRDFWVWIIMNYGKITGGSVACCESIKKQEQIDNLQIAFNILQADLKELGYETNDR